MIPSRSASRAGWLAVGALAFLFAGFGDGRCLAQATAPDPEAVLQITLLGTGNPRPSLDRFGPSLLVEAGEHRLLIDAGRGVTQRLFQIGSGALLRSVDTLVITHLHADHVVGIPDLWLTGWLFGRGRPLEIYGPAGTEDMAAHLAQAYAFETRIRQADEGLAAAGSKLEARDVEPGQILERGSLRITAFTVDHGGGVEPAYGYRIDFRGRSAVISGDTRPSPEVVRLARGADVLIHEVVSPEVERRRAQVPDPAAVEKIIAHHTTPEQAGEIFRQAHPRLAVYSHIVPSPTTPEDLIAPTRKTYQGPLAVGYDLMTIRIGAEIEVYPRPTLSDR